MQSKFSLQEFLSLTKNSFQIFQNFSLICAKADSDGYLQSLASILDFIFESETKYAASRDLTRTRPQLRLRVRTRLPDHRRNQPVHLQRKFQADQQRPQCLY